MLQVVFASSGGLVGTPAVQTSLVHWLVSTGLSVSSLTVWGWPLPSHWTTLQSLAICIAAGSAVPTAVLVTPHVPFVQVCAWQKVSVPQLAAVTQPTQAPLPLHIRFVPQTVPVDRFGFRFASFLQTSPVQAFLSTGWSVSSMAVMVSPLPSHWNTLQSPVVWLVIAVPAAMLVMPQAPLMHVR